MAGEKYDITQESLENIAELSDGYSGADIKNLCSDASMGPIRCIDMSMIQNISSTEVTSCISTLFTVNSHVKYF